MHHNKLTHWLYQHSHQDSKVQQMLADLLCVSRPLAWWLSGCESQLASVSAPQQMPYDLLYDNTNTCHFHYKALVDATPHLKADS